MIRVIKLGGSLFTMPNLLPTFNCWIQREPAATNVLVVGGGAWVRALREVQANLQLDDRAAHWLAVDAMSLTARLISEASSRALPGGFSIVSHQDELVSGHVSVLDVAGMLRTLRPPLPESWSVTSDSLAAWAARSLDADELVLLKSRDARANDPDLVDPYFREASQGIPSIRIVNFREMEDRCRS